MKTEQAKFLVEALEDVGAEIREDYSGRGMYGKSTVGVVVEADLLTVLNHVIVYCRDYMGSLEDDLPEFQKLRTDQMGRDSIILY